jgi:mRNA interferase MazF
MTTDNDDKPPRVVPRLKAAPDIRQLYWCDFPKDAHLPEFWKRRPVIIISFKNILSGSVTVVPCSSQDQACNRWAMSLSTTIDGSRSSAICDKISSVAVSRLTPEKNGTKRLPEAEFNRVPGLVLQWLPRLPAVASTKVPTSESVVAFEAVDAESDTSIVALPVVLEC